MDAVRTGRTLRAIRHRLGLRQCDVATRAGCSQQTVSVVERGGLRNVGLTTLDSIAGVLEARIDVTIRWRGADLDRVLDAAHAALVAEVVLRFAARRWESYTEVSYSEYGERGSIDLVAIQRGAATVVIVEVKSELAGIEATLRKHDEKIRLAASIARRRFGLVPRTVVGLLVLPDTTTARRRVAAHHEILQRAYPLRGRVAWSAIDAVESLGRGRLAPLQLAPRALVFLPLTSALGVRSARTRCRIARRRSEG